MATRAVEDYIKGIYHAESGNGGRRVGMGEVARALGVVPGTATTMVKALAKQGLLDYRPRVGVRLSERGRALAISMVRRHRLTEVFLVEALGMDWAEIHEEAERLEHALSDRVVDAIDAFLGHPTQDPHGDPIPNADGRLRSAPVERLVACAVGATRKVARIADQEAGFLQFAERHDLKPGTQVRVIWRDAEADATLIEIGEARTRLTLGSTAAEKIYVTAPSPG